MNIIKTCTRCQENKSLSEFYPDRAHNSYRSICKACAKDKTKTWKKANPEKVQVHQSTWNKNNKMTLKEYHLQKTYGLSFDDYFRMLEAQNHRCTLCGVHQEEYGEYFCVDHCHSKGHVRTLLCRLCNTGLGHFRDSPELLRKAADYLEEHDEPRQRSSGDGTTSGSTEGSQRTARETEEV